MSSADKRRIASLKKENLKWIQENRALKEEIERLRMEVKQHTLMSGFAERFIREWNADGEKEKEMLGQEAEKQGWDEFEIMERTVDRLYEKRQYLERVRNQRMKQGLMQKMKDDAQIHEMFMKAFDREVIKSVRIKGVPTVDEKTFLRSVYDLLEEEEKAVMVAAAEEGEEEEPRLSPDSQRLHTNISKRFHPGVDWVFDYEIKAYSSKRRDIHTKLQKLLERRLTRQVKTELVDCKEEIKSVEKWQRVALKIMFDRYTKKNLEVAIQEIMWQMEYEKGLLEQELNKLLGKPEKPEKPESPDEHNTYVKVTCGDLSELEEAYLRDDASAISEETKEEGKLNERKEGEEDDDDDDDDDDMFGDLLQFQ